MAERTRIWELEGAHLDLLVAHARGQSARIVDGVCMSSGGERFEPSSDWTHGGPLVEEAQISIWRYPDLDSWHACTGFDFTRSEGLITRCYMQGATPLVAAMRCFAAAKLGTDPISA